MRKPTSTDLLFNVLFPLLLGTLPYCLDLKALLPALIINHLSDACWAYAFSSCLLIIWNRRIHTGWIVAALLISIDFEALQYYHFIAGTGDLVDVYTYLVATGLALAFNHRFKRVFITEPHKTETYAYEI